MAKSGKADFDNAVVFDKVDINSSIDPVSGQIKGFGKIEESVESIKFAFDHGARTVVVASHQGDQGKNESLKQHADVLQKFLPDHRVIFAGCRSGDRVSRMVEGGKPGDVLVLENTRSEQEEWEYDDPKETGLYKTFSKIQKLAGMKDDPASHRKELSSYGFLKQLAEEGRYVTTGPLFAKEAKRAQQAQKVLQERRSYAILGGRKFSDLIELTPLLMKKFPKMDVLMAGLFGIYIEHVNGTDVGENMKHIEKEHRRALTSSENDIWKSDEKMLIGYINRHFNGYLRGRLSLPHDYYVRINGTTESVPRHHICKGAVLDIGAGTIDSFRKKLGSKKNGAVLISGSTGYYEVANGPKEPGLLGATEVYGAAFDPENKHFTICVGGDASTLLKTLDMTPDIKTSAGKAFIKRLVHGLYYDCDFINGHDN